MTINAIFMTISVLAICATVVLTLLIKTKDNRDRRQQSAENLNKLMNVVSATATAILSKKAAPDKDPEE